MVNFGITTEALEWIKTEYQEGPREKVSPSPQIPAHILDAIPRKHLDVVYSSTSERCKLDLYLPSAQDNPVPLVAFIHGGGFVAGSKDDLQVSHYFSLLNCGYAVASIGYRLAPQTQFPGAVLDCKEAIDYLKANADEFGLDANRFAVAGGSAGAYYALMVALTGNVAELEPNQECVGSRVKAAVALYSPIKFDEIETQRVENGCAAPASTGPSPEELLLGAPFDQLSQETLRLSNPMNFISSDMPPLFMRHGSADCVVPCQQSVNFAKRVEELLGPGRVDFALVEGADHAQGPLRRFTMTEEIRQFLDAALG